jgi:hypothetical protein
MKNYVPFTVSLEENYDFKIIEEINRKLAALRSISKFGADSLKLQLIHKGVSGLLESIALVEDALD